MTSHHWGQKAPHACSPCRKQKKACDGNFLSLFIQLPDIGSLESLESLYQRLTELEDEMSEHRALCEEGRRVSLANKPKFSSHLLQDVTVHGSSTLLSAFFLYFNVFRHRGMHISQLKMDVEVSTLKEIGDSTEIQTIVGAYFISVAPWMPVISRKRT
ncbi:hypothetical protein IFR05_011740 [Cadophora sp. M221]|nr:hypothetical protein IFR05_011740 [Cadophora sp. M221]